MASNTLSPEEKQRVLKALEEDAEFRYAVAGLIGLRDVLEELRSLREQFNKLYEKSLEHDKRFEEMVKRFEVLEKKLLEHDKRFEEMNKRFEAIERKLLEHDKRFEAIERKLLEHDKRFEAIERKLLEHDKRFEAIEKKLLEHDKRLEAIERRLLEHSKIINRLTESVRSLTEAVGKLASQITALGNRYGVYTEEAFRESMKYVIQDLLETCRVERWVYYDSEGVVYGAPSIIEVDVLIRDDQHVLVEYKASTDKSDILEIHRVGKLYEKVTGKKPKLLIVSPTIRKRARELAEKLGVEVKGVIVEA